MSINALRFFTLMFRLSSSIRFSLEKEERIRMALAVVILERGRLPNVRERAFGLGSPFVYPLHLWYGIANE